MGLCVSTPSYWTKAKYHIVLYLKKNLGHDFSTRRTHINNEHFTKPEKFSMIKNWTLFFTYSFWYVTMRFYHAQR